MRADVIVEYTAHVGHDDVAFYESIVVVAGLRSGLRRLYPLKLLRPLEQLRDDVSKGGVRVDDRFSGLIDGHAVPYVHVRDELANLVGPGLCCRRASPGVLRFEDDELECHIAPPGTMILHRWDASHEPKRGLISYRSVQMRRYQLVYAARHSANATVVTMTAS